MITKHNSVSISGTAQNARQRLGEVIKFHRTERGKNVREVSRRLKISVADVEAMERGTIQPTADEWKGLCQGVSRSLNAYNELRLQAIAERDAEANNITRSINVHATRTNGHTTKIGTNLGSLITAPSSSRPAPDSPTAPSSVPKAPIEHIDTMAETQRPSGHELPVPAKPFSGLVGVQAPAAEPKPTASEQLGIPVRGFAADGRKLSPVRPEGADAHDARTRRREFVRDMLRRYPNKRTSGADSVIEHVRKAFGIGISPDAVEQIREELRRESIKAEILAALPPVVGRIDTNPNDPPLVVREPEERVQHIATGEVNAADLEAAVQLVLGAVPGLQTFTISVDENGEASVDYQVRKVVVTTTGGSLKVRR